MSAQRANSFILGWHKYECSLMFGLIWPFLYTFSNQIFQISKCQRIKLRAQIFLKPSRPSRRFQRRFRLWKLKSNFSMRRRLIRYIEDPTTGLAGYKHEQNWFQIRETKHDPMWISAMDNLQMQNSAYLGGFGCRFLHS